MNDLKIGSDSEAKTAFGANSPIDLKPIGEQWLKESGWKDYIEKHKPEMMKKCQEKKKTNPYEVQQHVFKLFDDLALESQFEDKLKKFAFDKGTTMAVLRRVGAIHFRNLCLDDFGMRKADIDKHGPKIKTEGK